MALSTQILAPTVRELHSVYSIAPVSVAVIPVFIMSERGGRSPIGAGPIGVELGPIFLEG